MSTFTRRWAQHHADAAIAWAKRHPRLSRTVTYDEGGTVASIPHDTMYAYFAYRYADSGEGKTLSDGRRIARDSDGFKQLRVYSGDPADDFGVSLYDALMAGGVVPSDAYEEIPTTTPTEDTTP